MIEHHPDTDILMDYAAGSLAEPMSLVMASHLSMCGTCRGYVDELEAVGGALLSDIGPYSMGWHGAPTDGADHPQAESRQRHKGGDSPATEVVFVRRTERARVEAHWSRYL